jgi:hypothetical protein
MVAGGSQFHEEAGWNDDCNESAQHLSGETRMVAKEFIEELKSVFRHFNWCYSSDNKKIRGYLRSQDRLHTFDPIRAVCYVKTGTFFDENEWIDASEQIGLSLIDSGDLTAAANNVQGPPGQRSYTRQLRKQIIDTLMLKPETSPFKFWPKA